jgi:hypothetical protein
MSVFEYTIRRRNGQRVSMHGKHANTRTLSKHERWGVVQAGIWKAKEQEDVDDGRQCTREPL